VTKKTGLGAGDAEPLNKLVVTGLNGSHLPQSPKNIKSRGGRSSRDKGARGERALVKFLQAAGFSAERVPLSGAAGGRFSSDVSLPLLGVDRRVEVKCRATGFKQIYDWLSGADFLVVRADRAEPLVILPLKLAAEIAAATERGRR
jgi:hypothetical protein